MTDENRAPAWVTKVSHVSDQFSRLYGYRVDELAQARTFTETIFLAFTGRLPTAAQQAMLDRFLVAGSAHGVAPSGAVVRSLVACGSPIQGAIAGGVLTIADVHGGAGEETARLIQEEGLPLVAEVGVESAAARLVESARAAGRRFSGFGHPLHTDGDPRGRFLLDSAVELGVDGPACELVAAMESALAQQLGRLIPVNIDGASAAVFTDLGMDWRFARPLMMVSRLPVNAAHAVEEMKAPSPGWRDLVVVGERYEGPEARPVPGPTDPVSHDRP